MGTWTTIFSLSFSLFLLMDAIGNVPLFITILKDYRPAKQRTIILREMVIALVVIVAFTFVGNKILDLLHVESYTTMIAGGFILFIIAIKMIFPEKTTEAHLVLKKEPFIVPLAIPLVAGPAVLAAVMLYSSEYSPFITVSAICVAWVVSAIILLSSSFLQKLMGERVIAAFERLMGLILTLIAVQMFLSGLTLYNARH